MLYFLIGLTACYFSRQYLYHLGLHGLAVPELASRKKDKFDIAYANIKNALIQKADIVHPRAASKTATGGRL